MSKLSKYKKYIHLSPPKKSLAVYNKLRGVLRSLSQFPVLRPFHGLGRSLLKNAEPPGRILVKAKPNQQPSANCRGITVISANLWHDWPRHRDMTGRLERFADLVESEAADILLLQEVTRTNRFNADEWLEARLGMAYVYTRANGHHDNGFEEGLSVFSRYPLGETYLHQLGDKGNPFIRRLALGTEIKTSCGGLLAFSVHLSLLQAANSRQLQNLRNWVGQVAGERPALIGGDFNADEHKPQIHLARLSWLDTFRHINSEADGTTFEVRAPLGVTLARKRLDYIFFKAGGEDWQVLESRLLSLPHAPHSDHRAVLTRLTPVGHLA